LITHHFLQIWPLRTATCSLHGKNNFKVAIFVLHRDHRCRGGLVGQKSFRIFF
jgi:hypothetical protein